MANDVPEGKEAEVAESKKEVPEQVAEERAEKSVSKSADSDIMESEAKDGEEGKAAEVEDTVNDGFEEEVGTQQEDTSKAEEIDEEEIETDGQEEAVKSEEKSEEKEEQPIDEQIEADEQERGESEAKEAEPSEAKGVEKSEDKEGEKSKGKEEEKSEGKEHKGEAQDSKPVDIAHKPIDFNFEQCELCKEEDGQPLCEYLDEGEKIGAQGHIYTQGTKSNRCKGREVVERYYLNELMIEHDWPVCEYCFADNERLYCRKWEIASNSVPLCAAGFFSCTGLHGEIVDMVDPVGWPEDVFLQRRDEFYKQEGVHCCGDRIILCEVHQGAYDAILSRPIEEFLPGSNHYEGQYHNGKRHGQGVLTMTSKTGPHKDATEYYEGQWEVRIH
jgi:hypothetical protein